LYLENNVFETKPAIRKSKLAMESSEIQYDSEVESDDIAKKMFENRKIIDSAVVDDKHEMERQRRLYGMIKSSSKYKHLQVLFLVYSG
jgi:hypothetical protein